MNLNMSKHTLRNDEIEIYHNVFLFQYNKNTNDTSQCIDIYHNLGSITLDEIQNMGFCYVEREREGQIRPFHFLRSSPISYAQIISVLKK